MALGKRQNDPFYISSLPLDIQVELGEWCSQGGSGANTKSVGPGAPRIHVLDSQFQAVGLAKQWDLWATQSWRTDLGTVERVTLPGFKESCSLTKETVEARKGLKVCLLFPDTLFTVGWFPFGKAHCKRRCSQRFCRLDLYHITVFFPGLLTDTISWSCSSLGKVNSGKSRSLQKIQTLGRQNHGDGLFFLDIRSILNAASCSVSPSVWQGLGKEWERKSIRFDKTVCKSCWSSLQRP